MKVFDVYHHGGLSGGLAYFAIVGTGKLVSGIFASSQNVKYQKELFFFVKQTMRSVDML